MQDCRKERRFTLRLPCLIVAYGDSNGYVKCQILTVNASSGGALVKTDLRLPVGKKVFIELFIQRDEWFGASNNSCIQLCGHVMRANGCEMALAFEKEYRIERNPNVLDFRKLRMERLAKQHALLQETIV